MIADGSDCAATTINHMTSTAYRKAMTSGGFSTGQAAAGSGLMPIRSPRMRSPTW